MGKIAYIGNDMNFGVPLLITLGSLFTIWASTFITFALDNGLRLWLRGAIFIPIILTVFIILGTTGFALFYGIKLNNPKLVRVWYTVKIVECVGISIGILCNIRDFMWGNYSALLGLLFIPCGVYLILCVKRIYNKMKPASIYQEVKIESLINEKV